MDALVTALTFHSEPSIQLRVAFLVFVTFAPPPSPVFPDLGKIIGPAARIPHKLIRFSCCRVRPHPLVNMESHIINAKTVVTQQKVLLAE